MALRARLTSRQTSSQLSKSTQHYQARPDMSDLHTLQAGVLDECARGDVLAWSKRSLAAFEAFGMPRELIRKQALQPRPRTIVRATTHDVLRLCNDAQENVFRHLLVGEPGCGKSMYLLQAVAHALESGWAVLYVPRCIDLINSSSAYMYSPSFATYLQPDIAAHMLQALLKVNGEILRRIETEGIQVEGTTVSKGSLEQVVQRALAEDNAHLRQLSLEHVIRTLAAQKDVPFLVALDDIQAFFMTSKYRDPDFVPLEAYELAVPRALLELVLAPPKDKESGLQRGAVLTALSSTHAEFPPSTELLKALQASTSIPDAPVPWPRLFSTVSCRGSATRVPEPHAYSKVHDTHLAFARASAFQPVDVGQRLDRTEAASLLDLLRRERAIWTVPNDEVFMAKLVESHGNMLSFEKSWRSTLM